MKYEKVCHLFARGVLSVVRRDTEGEQIIRRVHKIKQ